MVEPTITNAQGSYLQDTVSACYNRLPCGFCALLGRDCPKIASNLPWVYDTTCPNTATGQQYDLQRSSTTAHMSGLTTAK